MLKKGVGKLTLQGNTCTMSISYYRTELCIMQQLLVHVFTLESNQCHNLIQSCYPTFLVQLPDTLQQTQFLSVRVW